MNPERLNNLVRSAQTPDLRDRVRDAQRTPTPWDTETIRNQAPSFQSRQRQPLRDNRDQIHPGYARNNDRMNGYGAEDRAHGRNDSGNTGAVSDRDYAEPQTNGRRHDYDVQSMETSLSSPRKDATRNPIPAPTVTVRSEFPTLSRSRQKQSLTCLVTVEVVDGKWRPDPEDLRSQTTAPPAPREESYVPSQKAPSTRGPIDSVHEESEALQEATEDLHRRVDNWHGLDFTRFGRLILHGTVRVGKDRQSWQDLECYLFTEMLICVKEKKLAPTQQIESADRKSSKCTLKGSILIKKHLKQVETVPGILPASKLIGSDG